MSVKAGRNAQLEHLFQHRWRLMEKREWEQSQELPKTAMHACWPSLVHDNTFVAFGVSCLAETRDMVIGVT